MYNLNSFKADPEGVITSVSWSYTNDNGSIRSTTKLSAPLPGLSPMPIEQLDENLIMGFVKDQIGATDESFDIEINSYVSAQEYQNSLLTYVLDENGLIAKL
tara:strand:- start:201 stop:506 length:306 start_codon:yes stop_codon:yes gene_type:complete